MPSMPEPGDALMAMPAAPATLLPRTMAPGHEFFVSVLVRFHEKCCAGLGLPLVSVMVVLNPTNLCTP